METKSVNWKIKAEDQDRVEKVYRMIQDLPLELNIETIPEIKKEGLPRLVITEFSESSRYICIQPQGCRIGFQSFGSGVSDIKYRTFEVKRETDAGDRWNLEDHPVRGTYDGVEYDIGGIVLNPDAKDITDLVSKTFSH